MSTPVIETMPVLFGEQFYPGGIPLHPDSVYFKEKSMQDIFQETTVKYMRDNESIICDYYRYYLLAPVWRLEETTPEEIMNADLSELFRISMELGLDPF